VENKLSMLKEKKAAGPDRIPSEFIKYATPQFKASLVSAFNKFLGSETVPKSFQKAIIFPIFKKGDPKVTSNYRGISFQNALAKVFSALLLERLKNWVKNYNILTELQAAFRKGYSKVDNIFSLTSIARSYIDSGKKLYAFFVDFKAAFDSIDRRALTYKLSNIGISTTFLNVLQSLYTDNLAAVWDGEQLSERFTTEAGVKQECLLSPLLFSLFLTT